MNSTINLHSSFDCSIPSSSKIVVEDAIVISQGGRIVARVNAEYDLANVSPNFHQAICELAMTPIHLHLLPEERLVKAEQNHQRMEELPWWRRLFRRLWF